MQFARLVMHMYLVAFKLPHRRTSMQISYAPSTFQETDEQKNQKKKKKPSVGYILQNLPTHRKFSSCAKPHHPISSFSLCISKCPCNVQVSPCICHLSNSAPQTKVHLYNRAWADFSFGKSASRCIFDKSGYLF